MPEETDEVIMIQCPVPGCDCEFAVDDLNRQVKHMDEMHPNSEVVAQRLREKF